MGVGGLSSIQSWINGELASRLGNSTQAAVISFLGGLVALCVLLAVLPSMRIGLLRLPAALREGRLRRWELLGGLGGGTFVAGQTTASLYVDRAGLGPAGRKRVTGTRVVAAALAVVAVVVSVSDKLGSATFSVVAVLLGLAAGALLAVQGAINGKVAAVARSPLSATWVNFVVGTTMLVLLLAVRTLAGGPPVVTDPQPWWLCTGGLIGLSFVAIAAFVIAHLGVLLFTLCQIAGQVIGAVVLDLVVPFPGDSVTPATYLGAGLTLVAVVVGAGLLRRGTGSAG